MMDQTAWHVDSLVTVTFLLTYLIHILWK